MNQLWQEIFGRGIVKTAGDMGMQGELPTHPELLDWLAFSFKESGWDTKKLCKLIVMSASYRQDSKAGSDIKLKDPENRFLSHGPSKRMEAETDPPFFMPYLSLASFLACSRPSIVNVLSR